MNPNWQSYVSSTPEPEWKELLMRLLKCWGHIHDDWYENYWHKFGVTRDEGRKIVQEYQKFHKENGVN